MAYFWIKVNETLNINNKEREMDRSATEKSLCVYLNQNLLTAGSLYQRRRKGVISKQWARISIIQAGLLLTSACFTQAKASLPNPELWLMYWTITGTRWHTVYQVSLNLQFWAPEQSKSQVMAAVTTHIHACLVGGNLRGEWLRRWHASALSLCQPVKYYCLLLSEH